MDNNFPTWTSIATHQNLKGKHRSIEKFINFVPVFLIFTTTKIYVVSNDTKWNAWKGFKKSLFTSTFPHKNVESFWNIPK